MTTSPAEDLRAALRKAQDERDAAREDLRAHQAAHARPTAAPRTANATKAAIIHRAQRRAADPRKREHATLTVAAGMVAGTITVDDLADHIRRIVETAPAPGTSVMKGPGR